MSREKSVRLMPPPRPVPLDLALQLLFGGFLNQFGWFFFGFGMIFVWAFGSMADFSSIFRFSGPLSTVQGVAVRSEETSASVNDTPIYANYYRFEVGGQEYESVSYATGTALCQGGGEAEAVPVTIEFPEGDPGLSRIRGMRNAPFSPWIILLTGLFPLVGVGFIVPGLLQGMRGRRLLSSGLLGWGRLLGREPTNMRVNKQTVFELTFEFQAANGRRYCAKARTHETAELEDEAEEALLYSPFNPEDAVLLDSLPGRPQIVSGQFQARSSGAVFSVMLLPGLSILVHGSVLLLWIAA